MTREDYRQRAEWIVALYAAGADDSGETAAREMSGLLRPNADRAVQCAIVAGSHALDALALRWLLDQEQQRQWRPIEAAPKDGTPVLGWGRVACAPGQPEAVWVVCWATLRAYDDDAEPCWTDDGDRLVMLHLTHWMPLPAPPPQPEDR